MTPPKKITTRKALSDLKKARQALGKHLRALDGTERRKALKACREADIPPGDLADLAGVSRQRLHELTKDG